MKRIAAILFLLALLHSVALADDFRMDEKEFLLYVNTVVDVPTGYTPIYSEEDLEQLAQQPDGQFILMNNVECFSYRPDPYGVFYGELNGNGYTITYRQRFTHDLHDTGRKEYRSGLFAVLDGAEIYNLRVAGSIAYEGLPLAMDGSQSVYVGGIAGEARGNTRIVNCVSSVNVSNDLMGQIHSSGGIVGYVGEGSNVSIQYCRNYGMVIGGIVGECTDESTRLEIYACENAGDVQSGIIDDVYSCFVPIGSHSGNYTQVHISSCANSGDFMFGGIVGYVGEENGLRIEDCINTGDKGRGEWNNTSGGIAGMAPAQGIARCVQAGKGMDAPFVGEVLSGTLDESTLYCADSTGLRDQNTLSALEFDTVWELREGMPHPYPLELMAWENPYETAYVEKTWDHYMDETTGVYQELVEDYGRDCWAINLGREYLSEGLLAEAGALWLYGVENVNNLLSFDLTALRLTNSYDVMVGDLFAQASNCEAMQDSLDSALMSGLGDLFAMIKAPDDIAEAADMVQLLRNGTILSENWFTSAAAYSNLVGGISAAEMIIKGVSGLAQAADDSNYAWMHMAQKQACEHYGETFRLIAQEAQTKGNTQLHDALMGVMDSAMEMYTRSDYLRRMGQILEATALGMGLSAAEKNVLLDAVKNDYAHSVGKLPALAALPTIEIYKMAFTLGTNISNSLMHTDEVAYYGDLLARCVQMTDVLRPMVTTELYMFLGDSSFERARRFNELLDVYLNLQILACDYAQHYCTAQGTAFASGLVNLMTDETELNNTQQAQLVSMHIASDETRLRELLGRME